MNFLLKPCILPCVGKVIKFVVFRLLEMHYLQFKNSKLTTLLILLDSSPDYSYYHPPGRKRGEETIFWFLKLVQFKVGKCCLVSENISKSSFMKNEFSEQVFQNTKNEGSKYVWWDETMCILHAFYLSCYMCVLFSEVCYWFSFHFLVWLFYFFSWQLSFIDELGKP